MKEKVYLIAAGDERDDQRTAVRLGDFLSSSGLLEFIGEKDYIAVKTHFGEKMINGFIRPGFIRVIGDLVKQRGGVPFLTETSTLYRGDRSNAVDHIRLAVGHGFSIENTGMPVIMADGLFGDEEVEVGISGSIYTAVRIAALLSKIQGLIVASHFTGHIVSGFGGALKNSGMGLSSRRGKMIQHSTSKPVIKKKKCTACGECIRWCPVEAIAFKEGKAEIDSSLCIGCAECLAVCRFDAVAYNWSESYDRLQEKIAEHAFGVTRLMKGRVVYLNFLTRISKDCDCMGTFEEIVPDIGILVSRDPVAIDNASLFLIEERTGKKFNELSHNIPYRSQIEHSGKIGAGNPDFELVRTG